MSDTQQQEQEETTRPAEPTHQETKKEEEAAPANTNSGAKEEPQRRQSETRGTTDTRLRTDTRGRTETRGQDSVRSDGESPSKEDDSQEKQPAEHETGKGNSSQETHSPTNEDTSNSKDQSKDGSNETESKTESKPAAKTKTNKQEPSKTKEQRSKGGSNASSENKPATKAVKDNGSDGTKNTKKTTKTNKTESPDRSKAQNSERKTKEKPSEDKAKKEDVNQKKKSKASEKNKEHTSEKSKGDNAQNSNAGEKEGNGTADSSDRQGEQDKNRQDSFRSTQSSEFSDGRSKQKEFFKLELQRLETGLRRESSKIHAPEKKAYTPYVFNTLAPYYNTYTTRFLIELPDEVAHGNTSRNTAQGLTDPWLDLRMDRELPPVHPRAVGRQVAILRREKELRDQKKRGAQSSPTKKGGSTRLPKFPVVNMETRDLATKQLYYSDVPALRHELKTKYSSSAKTKVAEDYERTHQDFYRMELDKLDQVHPINRKHMTSAYFAYLQNTPGSKKAINECVKGLRSGKAN